MSNYGWIIDIDHIADEDEIAPCNCNAVGMTGPRDISPILEDKLHNGHGFRFTMWDDDGEKYYTGRLICNDRKDIEDYLHCPLRDFGTPNAGAVIIKFPGKSDWTSEWS